MSHGMQQEYVEEDYGVYQMAVTNQGNQDSTCWGCREGALNQLGHMNYGGCLYFEDEESSDESIVETQSVAITIDDDTEEEEDEGEEEGVLSQ